MTTPLTIGLGDGDGETRALVVSGEIDLSNIDTFSQALDDAIAGSTDEKLVVDLRAVDYLDSSGINALFIRAEHMRLIANPLLIRVLTVSGLTEVTAVESPRP